MSAKRRARACRWHINTARNATIMVVTTLPINCSRESKRPAIVTPDFLGSAATALLFEITVKNEGTVWRNRLLPSVAALMFAGALEGSDAPPPATPPLFNQLRYDE